MENDKSVYISRTINGEQIMVRAVQPGEILQESDMYSSSNGRWEKCPCPGLTLGKGVGVTWIRPL